MLLGVEAIIVAVVGIFFWCLPRHVALVPCRRCSYELSGLDGDNPTCPECGLEFAAARLSERHCPACQTTRLWRVDRTRCDVCEPPRAAAGSDAVVPPDSATTTTSPHDPVAFSLATDGSIPPPAAQARATPR
jgi:hypothetical protein